MTIQTTALPAEPVFLFAFSICTLMTDPQQYQGMLASFEQAGFDNRDCEFLMIDNSVQNQCDAYQGLNRLLTAAQGRYIICCHQDILLEFDRRPVLEQALIRLEQQDPAWAIVGNAGGTHHLGQRLTVRISDPHGENRHHGQLPARVHSLDENFLLLKNSANLGLSHDLQGFHHYGTDLCLQANHRGLHCYVIDFHLRHLSKGVLNPAFFDSKKRFIACYQQRLRSRWLRLPCTPIFLSGQIWLNRLANRPWVYRYVKRWQKLFKRKGD